MKIWDDALCVQSCHHAKLPSFVQEASAAAQKIASQLLSTQSPPWSDASFWIQASAEVGFVSKGRLQTVRSVDPQLPSRLGFLAVQPEGREEDGGEGRTPDASLDAGTSVETGIHRGVPLGLAHRQLH